MRSPGPQNPYEVYCYQCNVTAPVGTRRCIHCGGSISRGVKDPRRTALAALVGSEIFEADDEVEETPPSVASVVPKVALWFLVLFGSLFYRYCS